MPPGYARQALLTAASVEWRDAGVFERFWQNGLLACEQLDAIDWSWLSMDGCMTKSPLAGSKTGRNPTDRGKQGVKRSLMTDANGLPLSLVVAGANTHDIKLVADTLDALQTGRLGRRLHLCMDKGYEAEWLEACLKTAVTNLISSQGKRSRKPSKARILKLTAGSWRERTVG